MVKMVIIKFDENKLEPDDIRKLALIRVQQGALFHFTVNESYIQAQLIFNDVHPHGSRTVTFEKGYD